MIDDLDSEIDACEKELRSLGADHPYVSLLQSAPGIAWVLGFTIASEIGDISRFSSPKKLMGYTGLCPRVYQSGGKDFRAPITKNGPKYLRWSLIEAAVHASSHPIYKDLKGAQTHFRPREVGSERERGCARSGARDAQVPRWRRSTRRALESGCGRFSDGASRVVFPAGARTSGCPLVLVEHASEDVMSPDRGLDVRFRTRDRGQKADPAMGASRVVVPDIAAQDVLETATRDDENEVEALLTRRTHPPLRVRVRARRANRRADYLGAFRGEDLVEGARELGVPVADEEAEATTAFVEVRDQVPGYLGHPHANRVSRDPEDVDHATFDLDYDEHVEPLEPDGIDGEEVRCEDACRLGA